MAALERGLAKLYQADPAVEVSVQETGEHVIMALGELHLEQCLKVSTIFSTVWHKHQDRRRATGNTLDSSTASSSSDVHHVCLAVSIIRTCVSGTPRWSCVPRPLSSPSRRVWRRTWRHRLERERMPARPTGRHSSHCHHGRRRRARPRLRAACACWRRPPRTAASPCAACRCPTRWHACWRQSPPRQETRGGTDAHACWPQR